MQYQMMDCKFSLFKLHIAIQIIILIIISNVARQWLKLSGSKEKIFVNFCWIMEQNNPSTHKISTMAMGI